MTNTQQTNMAESRTCPRCGAALDPGVPEDQCPKCMLGVGLGSQTEVDERASPPSNSTPPPEPAELAQHFPQLEILECIGQGGMGIVYKARQPRLDRLVALKVLPADPGRDPSFAERFTREARALARLSHPNIVPVYDFGETGGMYYLLMEFVDGLNLRQLERSGQLSSREALNIVPSICEALQYAHDQGIVHRDIKPENILMDKQGRVKIADFGLAKILGQPPKAGSLTQSRQVMGTPHYMAPEQIETPQAVDHRADIYSLGVVFYEMLTGELPIGRFAPPSQKVSIDVRLDEVVLRALEKERERRYQTAREVGTDVVTISREPAQDRGPETLTPEAADWEQARHEVKGPAIGLIATGILNWLLVPVLVLSGFHWLSHRGVGAPFVTLAIPLLLIMGLSILMILAGLKMKAVEAYPLAVTGSILAIIVTPGNLIGLFIGIWALVVLTRPGIRQAFGLKPPRSAWMRAATGHGAPAGGADTDRRVFFRVATGCLVGFAALVILFIGVLFVSMFLPTLHRAREAAQTAAANVQTQKAASAWLESALADRLADLNVRYASLQVRLVPSVDRGICQFTGLEELRGIGQTNLWIPVRGQLLLTLTPPSTWQAQGTEQLAHLQFVLESPPATTSATNLPSAVPR